MTSDDRHRDRDVTAQTLEALLHAITNRLTEVTIAKVKGRQGRKGTRHWTPPAGQPMSTKALDPTTVVDPDLWRQQVEQAAWQVLGPAGVAAGNKLRRKLVNAGVQPGTTQTVPPEQAPLDQTTPPPAPPPAQGGDGAEAHPLRDYAIYKAVRWLGDGGASKANELRDKIAAAEQADVDARNANAIEQVRRHALTEGSSVEPIVAAVRDWQHGPDGTTGLGSWSRTRAEAATTATIQGVHHGILSNLPPNVTVTRTWATRLDDRVRTAHRFAEGQTVAGDEPFLVGGERLRYPGDPLGRPDNVINCRCHAPYRIEVAPETKDKVATAAGAEFYGEPIGTVIERHRKPTHARPGTLPGNVDAVGWGHDHEASLEEVRPVLLGGLGGRDEHGQHPEGHPSRGPNPTINVNTVQGEETVQAKREVAAELVARMTAVSDADLLGDDLAGASDPDVLWRRDASSGKWLPWTGGGPADEEIRRRVRAGEWDRIPSAVQIGTLSVDIGSPQDRMGTGGPDMVRRLREQAVSDLVHKWAETSNDHSAWSLAIQQVVAEEFGVTDTHEWTVDADTQQELDTLLQARRPVLAAFVHAQYQATQDRLEQAGLDTLNLYRGMHWDTADDVPDWARGVTVHDGLEVPLRPASSFTANGETASFFAQNLDGPGLHDEEPRLVLSAQVPRERILATPRTGVGCLGEWEFVVLGGTGTFSVVGENLGGDEEPLSDHDLGWMPVGSFDDGEVLRALTLNPSDARRRELLNRAGDLGIQTKALPTGDAAPAGPTADDVRNEDWIKTRSWDVRDWDDQPVTTLDVLAARLGTDVDGAKQWLKTMPAGEAAPKPLRREAGLKGGGEVKDMGFDEEIKAADGIEHEAWTAEEEAKHPRGVHGRFAHTWLHIMKSHSSRDPAQVITDTLTGTPATQLDWKRYLDGYTTEDGDYYIERRISGNRLYVKDPNGEDITDGPFPKGHVVGTGTVAELRAKADEHAKAVTPAVTPDAAPTEDQRVAALAKFTEQGPGYDRAVAEDLARYRNEKRKGPNDQTYAEHWLDQAEKAAARRSQGLHSEQGGRSDEQQVRGDGGSQLAEGRAGGVRGDQGQADVLPRAGGGSATSDRPGGGGERRVSAEGRDVRGAATTVAGGPDDGRGDSGAGVAGTASTGRGDAGPGERVAAASDTDTGRGGSEAGGTGLSGREERPAGDGTGTDLVTEADQPEADPSQIPNATGEDFKPEGIDDLSPAGKVAKLNANMAALRTLRGLQSEHRREATPEEQATLAKWSGWGGLPAVFDPTLKDYEKFAPQREELSRLLSPKEILEARKNTLNAHYTDARVVEQIWKAVGELGFDGGRVLEPGSGSGTFIGFSPEHAAMVGVELDSTTAAISQYLYPSAAIRNESFANTNVPDGSFDATVGNVPFGDFALTDRRHNRTGESIHNHFILKSLALTRPGGIVAVLTSRHTLDSAGDRARKLMADKADLIGAIRLPTGSHQRASETGVIEDVLFFRVRAPGEEPQADQSWVHATRRDVNGFRMPVNDYWQEHPDHVLGELTAEKGQHGTGEMLVRGDRGFADLPAAMDKVVAQAKAEGLTATPSDRQALPELVTPEAGRHEGHIRAEKDGTFTQAVGGASRPHAVPSTQEDELRQLIGLRDNLAALLSAEAATKEDTPQIEALRHALNARYDSYVEQFGPIKRFKFGKANVKTGTQARNRPPQGGFRSDPMSSAVRALEDYDPVTGTATKADIFTKRAVAPRELKTTADNPRDALTLSMETYGDVNLPAIAKMLGTDEADARRQLGDLVFEQPPLTDEEQVAAEAVLSAERLGDIAAADAVDLSSVGESVREAGRIEPAAEYLSGNVRRKLAAARAAAAHDPRFKANVAALEKVIPTDLGPDEIDGRLGASWIGPDTIEAFLRDLLNQRQSSYRPDKKVMVAHSGGSIWTVVGPRQGTLSTQTWGTPDLPAPALVARLLEQRPITVTREVTMPDGTTKDMPDAEATLAAQAKAQEVQQRFAEWLWENPDRARRLAATYNDRFNAIVLRKYEADPDRVFPGLSEEWAEPGKMLPHVKTAAERIVQEPTVLLAHVVGAGKTAEMAMGTQELRRLGLARKPAIVIPNHLLEQFSREYLEIYPQAKILTAGKDDVDGPKRREFVARAATGDWDAVIMTRSAFERIPMSSDQTQAYIDREMATMRQQLVDAEAVSDQNTAQKRTVKKMEKALIRAEEKLKKLLDREKDAGVSFEQTGIDYLMVDEAHDYSNLRTLSNIMGAGADGSGMATDLHMKMEYLRAHNASGRVATFASGTPIRNTITQAYVMQRFLRPDLLEDAGIHTFDQWAATFGEVVDEMELKPEGKGFRQTQRFARFRNVPELLKMFHTTADVKMAEDLNLKTPKLAGGKMEIVDVPASDELRAYIEELGERASAVRAREVEPEEDNMLKISTDGRKAALSMKLVGQEHQPGKIEAAADRIAAIHEENKDRRYGDDPIPGALQLVFLDFGTPQDDEWNAYEHLKGQLVARGMDPESIRFVQDAKNDAEKAELFAAAKNGRIHVLIGSTVTMGTGTNVQKRAIALHHLDAPWRPSDVEQRDGRIMRQGNMHMEMDVPVQVIRYVTVPSFDTYMWQTLTRKAKFIHQIMRGKLDVREIDDIGDQALDYAEVMAVSTGDPNMLEKARLDEHVTKLERLERAHGRQQTNMRAESARLEEAIPQWQRTADQYDAAIAKRQDTRGDAFAMTIDGEEHGTRVAAGKALLDHLNTWKDRAGYYTRDPHPVGNIGGHTVVADIRQDYRSGGRVIHLRFADVPGDPVAEIPVSKLGQINGAGTVTRLENALYALEARRDRLREAVATGHDERRRLQERIGMPFAQATPLHEARVRQAQLVEAMQPEPTLPT